MTTQAELKAEIERQAARLNFTSDPFARKILKRSIADLIDAYKVYPAGLVWCAKQKPEPPTTP